MRSRLRSYCRRSASFKFAILPKTPNIELFSVEADDLRADLPEAIHMDTSFREVEMPGNGRALLRDVKKGGPDFLLGFDE